METRKLPVRDQFFWLGEMNKASAVINASEGLLDASVVTKVAQGIKTVIDAGNAPGGARPGKVIQFEPLLIDAAGMDVTMLHIGRSSQDMHATFRSTILRDNLLVLAEELAETMQTLSALAENNKDTIVPNYTNGVAAQPNSYAHYLLGFLSSFDRDSQRLRELYARVNYCAMGTTVLNGTSWPLNRDRMASYLGFAAPVENAYDAAQMKSVDEPVELASILTSIALHVGSFIQDVSVQYAQPRPWILLQEGGDNTYVSSAMPQKRNPGLMINTRIMASKVIGDAQTTVFYAHNITPGMTDPKSPKTNTAMVQDTIDLLTNYRRVLKALRINPERALEELNNDWTASQEVADVMMREYKLPFRVGHHVASALVTYGRQNNIKPSEFPYEEMKRLYAEVVKKEYPVANPVCPMSEEEFRSTLDPKAIILHRRTSGGPQPAELNRCLTHMNQKIAALKEWQKAKTAAISEALGKLDADFLTLLAK